MSDAGEALVDTESRLQERLDERVAEARRRAMPSRADDPERQRELESLRLARTELARQEASTSSSVRREQIALALAEIDRRLAGD